MLQFLLHIVVTTSITLYVVLGYNLVFGKGKILHFGLEAQSLVAVYTLWVLVQQFNQPFVLALTASVVLLTAVSLLLSWLSLRLEPDGFGVMSIALHLAALAVVLNWQSVTRGALGLPQIPRGLLPQTTAGYAVVTVGVLVVWVFFLWCLHRGSVGRQLAALSEHGWHAESLGINRPRVHALAFLVAGGGTLLSAILWPPYQMLITPSDYNFPHMIFFIMCVVAGGPGRLWGVLLSTTALVSLREGLRLTNIPADIVGPVQLISFGAILLLAIWLRRETVFPQARNV